MAVKTKVVNTSATNPAEFLSGATVPEAGPVDAGNAEAAPAPATPPGDPPAVVDDFPATPPVNRPGLETIPAPVAPPQPDPFVLLQSWKGEQYMRSIRAMPVPGGCIVRHSTTGLNGNGLLESVCFVPGVKIENGKLVSA